MGAVDYGSLNSKPAYLSLPAPPHPHLSLIFSVILLKKKYRNLATKERRKAIKEFSMKKTDDLKQKPWQFFKTFRLFLGKSKGSDTISLETEENSVETDESIISNKFAHYFTNIASTIGGNHVLDLSEEDPKNHATTPDKTC